MLFLVRHGRPRIDPGLLPSVWELDPDGFDDDALRQARDEWRHI